MRGLKINKPSRNLDIVLVAARYGENGLLEFATGYERRGVVWTDVRIYEREALIDKVRAGAKIVTGDPVRIPGNYEPIERVRLEGENGEAYLIANGSAPGRDDLGLPIL